MKSGYSIGLLLFSLATAAFSQQTPRLAYVYPAGAQAGSSLQITVGGQFLMPVSNVLLTGTGVETTIVERIRPMNPMEFNMLRDRFNALQQKFQASTNRPAGTNVWTDADEMEREEISQKMLKNPPNRTANPSMVESVILQITISSNAPTGDREIRLATLAAVSNPLRFRVGGIPETAKPAGKPANPDLDRFLDRLGRKPAPAGTPKYETNVSLPVTLNGQIMPGGVDRYRFSASRGQQLVLSARARALMPYLADAVPGWFEPALTVYDDKGRELTRSGRHGFQPDPVILFKVPRDDEYIVEIHDSIYRGREDFVYRLTAGELPFVTGIYPLGGKAGQKTSIAISGWNLATNSLEFEIPAEQSDITALRGLGINDVPFAVDNLPESFAAAANNSMESAKPVRLPVIINGRINRPGEGDVFKFDGTAGQQIVAEVTARRLESPLDSVVRLTDASGRQLAVNDDFEDRGAGLETHHADSLLIATLPADGTYYLHLGDVQGHGGPEFAYRLRLAEPRPDFTLRVVPSSAAVRAGMSAPLTVHALRRDGFTNAIDLKLLDAPPGFSLSGVRVPANQDKAQFTLHAPADSAGRSYSLAVIGSAVVAGQIITRQAVPAEDRMQAFVYRHLVPSLELVVIVTGAPRPFARDAIKILSATPIKLRAGGTTRVSVATPSAAFVDRFELALNGAPPGISLQKVWPATNGIDLVIATAGSIAPGATGNLIIDVLPKNPPTQPAQSRATAAPRRTPVNTLPAIPFEVVAE